MFQKELIIDLRIIYWIEKYHCRLLLRLEKTATTRYLKACFKGHQAASRQHLQRVETIFALLGEKPKAGKCIGMESLIKEAMNVIKITKKGTLLREIGLITAAQKIEDFEIKKYNRLVHLASSLARFDIVSLLEETIAEEKEAEETFVAIKQDTLNDELFKTAEELSDSPFDEEDGEILEPSATRAIKHSWSVRPMAITSMAAAAF